MHNKGIQSFDSLIGAFCFVSAVVYAADGVATATRGYI